MRIIAAFTIAGSLCAASAFAALSNAETKRLNEAGAILTELRGSSDKGVPQELWSRAECVVVIPSMKKAAFVVGGEYGSGVMSCRTSRGPRINARRVSSRNWSSPIFMQLAKGSWGLQIGAEQTDVVLLIMNQRGVEKLLSDKLSLGADASVAGGPVGRTMSAATNAQLHAEILSYSRASGLFVGIDLSGGVLRPDKDADMRAYGPNVTARQVVTSTRRLSASVPGATPFLRALRAIGASVATN